MSLLIPDRFAAHLTGRGAHVLFQSDEMVFATYDNTRVFATFSSQTDRFTGGVTVFEISGKIVDVNRSTMKSLVDDLRLPVASRLAA